MVAVIMIQVFWKRVGRAPQTPCQSGDVSFCGAGKTYRVIQDTPHREEHTFSSLDYLGHKTAKDNEHPLGRSQ